MIATFAGLAFLAMQATPPEPAWTWTLYADEARVALANEVPDTPNLRFTLECDPASGVARVTFYGGPAQAGMARVTAGEGEQGGGAHGSAPDDQPEHSSVKRRSLARWGRGTSTARRCSPTVAASRPSAAKAANTG